MADAIPSPPGSPPTQASSTLVVQQPMSQWSALKEAGWWTNWDYTMLAGIAMVWVTGIYWCIFGRPGISGFIALLLTSMSIEVIWLITLIFRCSWFVLRMHADIATLPQESARIAVAYLGGKPPPPPPKKP